MTQKRVNLTSSASGGFTNEFPFIDHAAQGTWAENSGAGAWPTPFHQNIDSEGEPNTPASRTLQCVKLFFIPTPTQYSGNWRISWQGNLQFRILLNDGSISVSAHTGADWTQIDPITWNGTDCTMTVTFPGNTDGRIFVVRQATDANSTGAYGKRWRMVRADQITDFDVNGKVWNPVLKQKILALNPETFRTMEYQDVNPSLNCRWEYRPTAAYNGYGGSFYSDGAYGDASGTNVYTVATIGSTPVAMKHGEIAHVRFPNAIVRGGLKTVTGVTQTNPAVVTSAAHGNANGDLVRFYNGAAQALTIGMTQLADTVFTVANVTANTFELAGVNSTAYSAWTSGFCAIVCNMNVGARSVVEMRMPNGYANIGVYPTLTISAANAVLSFVYDQPTNSWLYASQNYFIGGFPLEILQQLFIELDAEKSTGYGPISPWFSIPQLALRSTDPDYSAGSDWVKNHVALLKNGSGSYGALPSTLDIWLEYSNETWNTGFDQTLYLAYRGFLRWANSRGDLHDFSTLRSTLLLNDAQAAYGSGSSRIKRVQGLQAALLGGQSIRWDGSALINADAWKTFTGNPGANYDYLAIAAYLDDGAGVTALENAATAYAGGDASQIDVANAIFNSNSSFGAGWFMNTMLPVYKTVANTYNLGIVQYEGVWGPGYNGVVYSQTAKDFFEAIKADSRWSINVVKAFWDAWNADSLCKLPAWFNFSGGTTGPAWSLFWPTIYDPRTVIYNMIVAFDAPPVSPGLQEIPTFGATRYLGWRR